MDRVVLQAGDPEDKDGNGADMGGEEDAGARRTWLGREGRGDPSLRDRIGEGQWPQRTITGKPRSLWMPRGEM